MAENGEFTKRAFVAGRLDLTQVEGLKDLINSETEEQRKWALNASKVDLRRCFRMKFLTKDFQGHVRDQIEKMRQEIIACLMLCEAEIDFGATEDIDEGVVQQGGLYGYWVPAGFIDQSPRRFSEGEGHSLVLHAPKAPGR